MPRRILATPALALAALALTAPAAPAKQLTQALVCGASGCRDVSDRFGHGERALETGAAAAGPTQRAPFYRVRFAIGEGGRAHAQFHVVYVPSQRLTSSVDDQVGQRTWAQMTDDAARLYRRAVRGITPLPASRLPMPRKGADVEDSPGALPPEVVAPPAELARPGGGLDAWPALALLIPGGGGAALLAGHRRSRRHRDGGAAPPGA